MTVKNLIDLLSACDPETRVVVAGYEGGVDDVSGLENIHIRLDANANDAWYYGRHEPTWDSEEIAESGVVPALCIG